jgi:hypothetical protein
LRLAGAQAAATSGGAGFSGEAAEAWVGAGGLRGSAAGEVAGEVAGFASDLSTELNPLEVGAGFRALRSFLSFFSPLVRSFLVGESL